MNTNFLKIMAIFFFVFTSCEVEETLETEVLLDTESVSESLITFEDLESQYLLSEYNTITKDGASIQVGKDMSSSELQEIDTILANATHLVFQQASKTILVFDKELTEKQISFYDQENEDYFESTNRNNAWAFPVGYSFTFRNAGGQLGTYNGQLQRQNPTGLNRRVFISAEKASSVSWALRNRVNRVLDTFSFSTGGVNGVTPVHVGVFQPIVNDGSSFQRKRQSLFTGGTQVNATNTSGVGSVLVTFRHTTQTRF